MIVTISTLLVFGTLTIIGGTLRNTNDKAYKMAMIAAAAIMLYIMRLLSLLGTKAVLNVFVSSESL